MKYARTAISSQILVGKSGLGLRITIGVVIVLDQGGYGDAFTYRLL